MTKATFSPPSAPIDEERRRLLRLGAMVLPMVAGRLSAADVEPGARRLALYNTHTGENLTVTYHADGQYVEDSLSAIDHLLRDHRTDEIRAIDVRLLDLLHRLSVSLETGSAFHVISGYRSPLTNATLASRSGGVASRSLHMDGMAIDIRMPGRDLRSVHGAAIALRGGGVGYYERSDFVHMDVGRVRYW